MEYGFIPKAMWALFSRGFREHLNLLYITDENQKAEIMKKARQEYRGIIASIDEFGENDTHYINIVSAAQFASIYLSLPTEYRLTPIQNAVYFPETEDGEKLVSGKYTLRTLSDFYELSMNENPIMKLFCKKSFFSRSFWKQQAENAKKSQGSTNPYSWRFTFAPDKSGLHFDTYFSYCGIWHLMQTLGIPEITPAMCRYDYGMAKLCDAAFSRRGTLAGGLPVCDCHYDKKA